MSRPARLVLIASAVLAAGPAAAQGVSPTLPMEAFAGRISFDALGGGSSDVLGGRLGIDLGRVIGAYGLYWRSFDGVGVQGYGAEAQLNLNAGAGVTPFLLGGVGRIDFLASDSGPPRQDRTLPVAGGGLRLELWRIGVQGTVRSHLVTSEDAEGGRDLRHAALWSVGAAFRLGRGPRAAPVVTRLPAPVETRVVRGDTVFVSVRDTAGPERTITIPIPREGEIYLRYGPAGATRIVAPGEAVPPQGAPVAVIDDAALELLRRRIISDLEPVLRNAAAAERAELRGMVRDELDRAAPVSDAEGERRLLERIDALISLRLREAALPVAVRDTMVPDTLPDPFAVAAEPRFQPRLRGLRPYIGGNFGVPRQFITGLRLDLGPFTAERPEIRLVPEAALGLGQGGQSVMLAANVAYEPDGYLLAGRTLRPYGYAGAGFLFIAKPPVNRPGREAVVNLGYGLAFPVPNHPAEFFVEHQGIDLFDLNRLIVGVRF
jgi:hypothetical protein